MTTPRDPIIYRWRQLNAEQREATLEFRRTNRRPWHSPPHWESDSKHYLITAACYEHRPVIGKTENRMGSFEIALLETCASQQSTLFAWVVLPNHYHLLVKSDAIHGLLSALGQLHGRSSYQWNAEDAERGRQVWFNALETGIKCERHFWASFVYTSHNPVKHGYVTRWQDWPYSHCQSWLEVEGREAATRLWKEFPINEFGADWDPPEL